MRELLAGSSCTKRYGRRDRCLKGFSAWFLRLSICIQVAFPIHVVGHGARHCIVGCALVERIMLKRLGALSFLLTCRIYDYGDDTVPLPSLSLCASWPSTVKTTVLDNLDHMYIFADRGFNKIVYNMFSPVPAADGHPAEMYSFGTQSSE